MAEADAIVTYHSEMSSVAFWIYGMLVGGAVIKHQSRAADILLTCPFTVVVRICLFMPLLTWVLV